MTQYPEGIDPESIRNAYAAVRDRVDRACARAGRAAGDVTLIAVSKTHPPEALRVLYDCGVRDFGESYVQELVDKRDVLPDDVRWHFIGRLQTNKARFVTEGVALIHSVDRVGLLDALERRAARGPNDRPVDVLLQVSLAGERTKGGVKPDGLEALYAHARKLEHIRVRGLMTMPPYDEDPQASRPYFARLRDLLAELREQVAREDEAAAAAPTELSMGMSNDFEVAIEEGATLVRVGTALFGERPKA